jgi:GNAT superfamily N-acetyltransferase
MEFEILTPQRASQIEIWFDDATTRKYLGGREDFWRGLELMKIMPGREAFDGLWVVAGYIWVVLDEQSTPVGLLDVEPYQNGEAGMAFLVAPEKRGQGIGVQMLQALEARPEMRMCAA